MSAPIDDVLRHLDSELRGSLETDRELDPRVPPRRKARLAACPSGWRRRTGRRPCRPARCRPPARTARPFSTHSLRWACTGRPASAASSIVRFEKFSRRLGDRRNAPSTSPGANERKARSRSAALGRLPNVQLEPELASRHLAPAQEEVASRASVGSTSVSNLCSPGTICWYSSSCLATGSLAPKTPVRFPPGWDRLSTRPSRDRIATGEGRPPGSALRARAVAACAAAMDLSSNATITSTRSRTNSWACAPTCFLFEIAPDQLDPLGSGCAPARQGLP